jgi:acetolactate synthase-1/2/3 large subunit
VTSTGMYLTKLLEAYGVQTIFGIPGVHTVELYRGLVGSSITHITPRHEQGAGFMADGYARATGKPGVCFIISGPGLTNIATAMGQAFADSIPMLVISTVNRHGRMGSGDGWLHELPNQQALAREVCAFSHTINSPEELPLVLARAFALFDSTRPRPVHIELPINVALAPAAHLSRPESVTRLMPPEGQRTVLIRAARLLDAAERPVILVGGGAKRAAQQLRQLAERLDAPVVMTTNGRGILAPDHPLAVSITPSMPVTRSLIETSDVVLAAGTEFGPTDYDMYEDGLFTVSGYLIRVDIDPFQIMRTRPPEMGIVGDASACLDFLAHTVTSTTRNGVERAAEVVKSAHRNISPAMRGDIALLECIRDTLPEALIVGDSTQLVYAGNVGFAAATPGSYFNSATGYGTLGYGLPAAIGAKLGAPSRPVVVLAGDGGFQFSLAELGSAIEAKTAVILLLHDNNGYGEIKSYMTSKNMPSIGVDLYTPDFLAIGAAYGWHAARLKGLSDVATALNRAASRDLPTMLVFGDELRAEAEKTVTSRL